MSLAPIDQIEFDTARLIREFPPHWHHRNKAAVFEAACSTGLSSSGSLRYTRWSEATPPEVVTPPRRLEIASGVFDYVPATGAGACEWHMNFADPSLFFAYGSALLAQDELQVLEHPILGSLREALLAAGKQARTVDASGRPTPVTITGVERRCAFNTLPDPKTGRKSLYGNAFARASVQEVLAACKLISPPTISNILAMAAPSGGWGAYSSDELSHILATAYTGFVAARGESERVGPDVRTVIHTGFWGCGAFGGNRILMTILQALAGELAEVDIVFHSVDATGASLAKEGMRLYKSLRASSSSTSQIVDAIHKQGFVWGESDGN